MGMLFHISALVSEAASIAASEASSEGLREMCIRDRISSNLCIWGFILPVVLYSVTVLKVFRLSHTVIEIIKDVYKRQPLKILS